MAIPIPRGLRASPTGIDRSGWLRETYTIARFELDVPVRPRSGRLRRLLGHRLARTGKPVPTGRLACGIDPEGTTGFLAGCQREGVFFDPGAQALEYGQTLVVGDVRCESSEDGVACSWAGGAGFTASRGVFTPTG